MSKVPSILNRQSKIDNSLCLFSSYCLEETIPLWVKDYLLEISVYVEKVVLLTNERQLSATDYKFLNEHKIELFLTQNHGWDFGMWSRYFEKWNPIDIDHLFLINDSNILVGTLDDCFSWWITGAFDFGGLTENWEGFWHIQSFFLGFRRRAVSILEQYFLRTGSLDDKLDTILFYEIGLSRYLSFQGLNSGVMYPTKTVSRWAGDSTIFRPVRLLKRGYPLIKKSLFSRSSYAFWYRWIFRRRVSPEVMKTLPSLKPSFHGLFWEGLDRVLYYFGGWKTLPRVKSAD